jgi:hypothetical protein
VKVKRKDKLMKHLIVRMLILVFAASSMIAFVPEAYTQNRNPQNSGQTGDRKRDRLKKKDGSCTNKSKQKKSQKKSGSKKGNKRGNGTGKCIYR